MLNFPSTHYSSSNIRSTSLSSIETLLSFSPHTSFHFPSAFPSPQPFPASFPLASLSSPIPLVFYTRYSLSPLFPPSGPPYNPSRLATCLIPCANPFPVLDLDRSATPHYVTVILLILHISFMSRFFSCHCCQGLLIHSCSALVSGVLSGNFPLVSLSFFFCDFVSRFPDFLLSPLRSSLASFAKVSEPYRRFESWRALLNRRFRQYNDS